MQLFVTVHSTKEIYVFYRIRWNSLTLDTEELNILINKSQFFFITIFIHVLSFDMLQCTQYFLYSIMDTLLLNNNSDVEKKDL